VKARTITFANVVPAGTVLASTVNDARAGVVFELVDTEIQDGASIVNGTGSLLLSIPSDPVCFPVGPVKLKGATEPRNTSPGTAPIATVWVTRPPPPEITICVNVLAVSPLAEPVSVTVAGVMPRIGEIVSHEGSEEPEG
jgi:hypothetical protein